MKKLSLIVSAIAAMVLAAGCQKYDDSQIRQEIKDLGERIAALEAWTRNSQEAVDYVAVLKEAVKNMKSIESVDVFEDEHGSGYVITFTNKQTIRLYNGNDGDAFFGNVNVGTSRVEFILADGTSFIVDRVTSSISFDSFDTKAVTKGHTVWTVMDKNFKKEDFAAFTAELKTDDGTVTSIATKSAVDGNPWKIEAVAPEFGEDGKLVKPAGVIFKETPQAGSKGVLRVALITNDGKESAASIVVEAVPDYLAFEAVEAGATVSMEIVGQCPAPSLEYSTDLDEWTTFDFGNPQTVKLENVGDKVSWRNTDKTETFSPGDLKNYIHFDLGSRKIAAEGNIMSLLDKECVMNVMPGNATFDHLFLKNSALVSAPELPATELTPKCYYALFNNCLSLEKAPKLPATVMKPECYAGMLEGCVSLVQAPELPATKLASNCYFTMFWDCSSLKEAPELPAKELADSCYKSMFHGCESLKKAPELPATKLADACYEFMFVYCHSLEEAPALPAAELPKHCYSRMFMDCSSLTEAPDIPAIKVGNGSCNSMFFDCTSLKKAPALPAKQLDEFCYQQLFCGCSSLEKVPELPAMELAPNCYSRMFGSCSSLKEPPVLPAKKMEELCYSFMFQDCESLETMPELPAMELAEACYCGMFLLCPSLKNTSSLPATKLEPNCYDEMFIYCSSLEEAPELPATELAPYCYYGMFLDCSSLSKAPELQAEILSPYCYQGMFYGCTSLEEAPYLRASSLEEGCYDSMFYECSNLKSIRVAFTDWGDGTPTDVWVKGIAAEGTFECPEGLEIKYGNNYIPSGWSVVSGGSTIVPEAYAYKAVPKHRISPRVEIRASLKAPKLIEPEWRIHK